MDVPDVFEPDTEDIVRPVDLLGIHDDVCLETDIFPEHVVDKYDTERARMRSEVDSIAETARREVPNHIIAEARQ